MADDLPRDQLSLMESKDAEVSIQKVELQRVVSRGQACVIGKLIAKRMVSKETIKMELMKWWRPLKNLSFKVLGENLFLRVKIVLDLTKPLQCGRKLNIQGKQFWVTFQYKRLPKFCFSCGVIRHGKRGCQQRNML